MTRPSKRELEREIEGLAPDRDSPAEITVRDTVVGTEWEGGDLDAGERREETERIIIDDSSATGPGGAA